MRIAVTASPVDVTPRDRLREVWYQLYLALDRPCWPTPYGLWANGINNNGLIFWSETTKSALEKFLRGETRDCEIEVDDAVLATDQPGTTLTEQRQNR